MYRGHCDSRVREKHKTGGSHCAMSNADHGRKKKSTFLIKTPQLPTRRAAAPSHCALMGRYFWPTCGGFGPVSLRRARAHGHGQVRETPIQKRYSLRLGPSARPVLRPVCTVLAVFHSCFQEIAILYRPFGVCIVAGRLVGEPLVPQGHTAQACPHSSRRGPRGPHALPFSRTTKAFLTALSLPWSALIWRNVVEHAYGPGV